MTQPPFHPTTRTSSPKREWLGIVIGGMLVALALIMASFAPTRALAQEAAGKTPETILYTLADSSREQGTSRQHFISSARSATSDHVIYLSDRLAIALPDNAGRALESTKGTMLTLYGLADAASPSTASGATAPLERRSVKVRSDASGQEVEWEGERAVVKDKAGDDVNVREAIVEAVDSVEDSKDLSFNYTPVPEALAGVEQAIGAIEERYGVGFVSVDLATGKTVSYASSTPYYAASTFKASYIAWLLSQKVDTGEVPLASVEQMVRDVIVESDNTAYMALRSMFGYGEYSQWLEQTGTGEFANLAYPTYSAGDLAKVWALDADYLLSGNGLSSWLRTLHLHSAESSIDEAVNDSDVYTKAGWIDEGGYRALNDAGVIMDFNGSPTLLVILTSATPDDHALLINLVQALKAV